MKMNDELETAVEHLKTYGFSLLEADLPKNCELILVVTRFVLSGFALFDELFSSGYLHAATGELARHFDLSGCEQL